MAKRRDQESQRFRWWNSDLSGFQFGFQPLTSEPNAYTRWSGKPVRDNGLQVAPSEYDTPPPSKRSLGGEGDISGDPRANSDFATPANAYLTPSESEPVVYAVNSSSSIPWNTDPVVYIVGSNANQVMAVNPQIVAGQNGLVVAFQGVGSTVTITTGNGVTFDFTNTTQINMTSGAIAVAIYTDNTWHFTSFNQFSGGF